MFALVVHDQARPPWRKAFALREVSIGADRENHLVLPDTRRVSGRHARLVLKDGKYILVDLKSATGTFVNGRRMTAPLVVKESDAITIGVMRIEIVTLGYESARTELVARDAREAELLAAITGGDDAARLVYADWLEGHGDHAHAELLRIQSELPDEYDEVIIDMRLARMRQLASQIPIAWRARTAKTQIEGCPAFAFQCPKQWSQLAVTAQDGVRFCGGCQKHVYYCATIDEARDHAGTGACVALDIGSPRWRGDLEPPFREHLCGRCDIDVGAGLRNCPRCGERIESATMVVGEMA
jgi:uncharacterized protein (TIGR02996 family)